ncbi:MAG: radical SAM protein [Candidatus Omnitrophota bacterium]
MKIALVECPMFNVRMPMLGPAYLRAVLEKNGHSVDSFDLNIRLFHQVPLDMRKYWDYAFSLLWSSRGINSGWQDAGLLSHLEFLSESLLNDWAQEILKSNAQVIGFTVYHTSVDVSVILAKKIKQLDATRKIIFGGPFVLSYIDVCDDAVANIHSPIHRVLDVIDMVAVGEGEDIMLDVVNRVSSGSSLEGCRGVIAKENGNLTINELRPLICDLDALPFPDFSVLKEFAYTEKNFLPILASRGCPSRCSFCDYPYMDRYTFRARKASCVVEEMERQIARYKTDFFHFNDSSITLNVSFLTKLCQLLIEKKLRVRWGGSASVNSVLTRDIFERMKQAGCEYLSFGIESASPKVLQAMNKGFHIQDAEKNIMDAHAAGISALTNWVVGHPMESSRDFQETLDFIKKNSECMAGIDAAICTVKPHTPLYEMKDRYGIQLNNLHDWSAKDNSDTYGHRVQRLKLLQEQLPDKFARDRVGGTLDVESALSLGEKKGKDVLL